MRCSWFILALDLGRISSSSYHDLGKAMVVPTESDSPSYFRVRVPSSAPALKISVEADQPIAVFAALGYFPKESHYDISNFPAWALGALSSEIELRLNELRESPCEYNGRAIEKCLEKATAESALHCGSMAPLDEVVTNASTTNSDLQDSCVKHVDTCTEGICRSRRGPTICKDIFEDGREGQCLCQQGFCADEGRCISADQSQATCMKITGHVCPYYACDDSNGPANCEDGICVCAPGHCAVGGVCQPGQMCRELGMRGMCDVASSPERRLKQLRASADAVSADDCCEVIDGARSREPGRFARCAAQHFFNLDHAHARGIHFPLLADLSEQGEPADELVVAVRRSATSLKAPIVAGDATSESEVEVRLVLLQDNETVMDANDTSAKLAPLQHFRTYQELIAPSISEFGGLPPIVQQLEAPLLQATSYAFNPLTDLDKPVDHTPLEAVRMRLRRQELLTLRLGEEALLSHAAGGGSPSSGILQLHVVDLPPGSHVLYSHAHPEPRSLMDFGHAQLVDSHERISGRPGAGIWRAPAAATSARFFAILPGADAHAAAFFAVHTLPAGDARPTLIDGGAVPPLPTAQPGGVEESDVDDLNGAAAARTVTRTLCLGAALSLAGAAAWAWCWKVYDQSASSGLRDKQRPYLAVSGSETEMAPPFTAVDGISDDDDRGSNRAALGVAARAQISSLRVFGEAVREKLGQTGVLLSSTRAGTSRFSNGSHFDELDGCSESRSPARCPHTEDEMQGLLSSSNLEDEDDEAQISDNRIPERSPSGIDDGSEDDLEALSALMKLRPAARDSVGDDADDEDVTAPLVGTGRHSMLNR